MSEIVRQFRDDMYDIIRHIYNLCAKLKKKTDVISQVNIDKIFQTKLKFKIILDEGFRIINENKNVFNVYHSLFKRYIYGFESIDILLKDFDAEKRHRELAISIVLRASLLDYLTTLYLSTYKAEKKLILNSVRNII